MGTSRYRVEIVNVEQGTGFCQDEHRVVDIESSRVVLRFTTFGYAHAGVDPSYEGVRRVVLDDDDAHVLVDYYDGESERLAIPERTK